MLCQQGIAMPHGDEEYLAFSRKAQLVALCSSAGVCIRDTGIHWFTEQVPDIDAQIVQCVARYFQCDVTIIAGNREQYGREGASS